MVDLTLNTSGLTGTAQLLVGPEHTAPFVGSGRSAVLATPVMINVIEAAALNAVPSSCRSPKSRHPPRREPCRGDAGRIAGDRNRDGFARGALRAARWLNGKRGVHEFRDILDDLVIPGEILEQAAAGAKAL